MLIVGAVSIASVLYEAISSSQFVSKFTVNTDFAHFAYSVVFSVNVYGKVIGVPLKSAVCSFALPDVAQAECMVDGVEHALFVAAP